MLDPAPTATPTRREPAGSARLHRIIWAALLIVVAIEVGVTTGRYLLAPLLLGTGGPRAQARAIVVLAGAALLLTRTRSTADASLGDEPTLHPVSDEPDEIARRAVATVEPSASTTDRPNPVTLHVTPHVVELFWDRSPPPAPTPWVTTATGWVWEADPARLPPVGRRPPTLPGFVALGTTPTGHLWLNLAAFRVVHLDGPTRPVAATWEALTRQLARRSATELTVAPVHAGAPRDRIVGALWRRRGAAYQRSGRARRRWDRARPTAVPLVLLFAPDADPALAADAARAARGDPTTTCVTTVPGPSPDLTVIVTEDALHVPFRGPAAIAPCWRHPTPATPSTTTAVAAPPTPSGDAEVVRVQLRGSTVATSGVLPRLATRSGRALDLRSGERRLP